ncbi:MAG TPA: DUF2179 domain-containing protein [Methanoculleus sp.]|jgi:uncharacterized protein YebE (UPF0316 family)|uniref:DUF2179 domain-containing protein n=1 Tax=Methanoculleus sp. TaxID=90427 RepID=UPI000B1F7654|nr:DUF5698 domain-containing protein [Methanoculleus sp.]MBP7145097.1 DUF2179 domain-containing protein [Methanoculleus sp.]HNQ33108.1 DUF2179 domain-containing protein [Methanoculleus sp.]HNT07620.1 DUF2179 domain-containing protein [Methanoculleus sp.]HNV39306.1 DUF2179 domain-containing protein [Methanoculleus sp.]HOI62203.1 DUF2179 domain-containing protein [Methanoculleus sp.]
MLGTVPGIDPEVLSLVIVPAFIFFARICDVTIGTMRIIFVSRGMKMVAPVLGFFEVFIWIIAVGQIFQNLTNPLNYFAYAAGFATGNYVGMLVEERLAMGLALIRVITQRDATNLIDYLRGAGYGVTVLDAQGKQGPGKVIFSVIKRKNIKDVEKAIHEFNPKAFYSIEDVRRAAEGTFPTAVPGLTPLHWHRTTRKGK